jgi:hypothetical protein
VKIELVFGGICCEIDGPNKHHARTMCERKKNPKNG